MNKETGKIVGADDFKKLLEEAGDDSEKLKKKYVPVNMAKATKKQRDEFQVSKNDNRSVLGKQLRDARMRDRKFRNQKRLVARGK